MVLGINIWALVHLLANGNLADVVLFGAFLPWAVLDFRAARRRDRINRTPYPAGEMLTTVFAMAVGAGAWAVFAFWAHGLLIGVRPLG